MNIHKWVLEYSYYARLQLEGGSFAIQSKSEEYRGPPSSTEQIEQILPEVYHQLVLNAMLD